MKSEARTGSYVNTCQGDWQDFLGDVRHKPHYLDPEGNRTERRDAYQSLHLVDVLARRKIMTPHRHERIKLPRKFTGEGTPFIAKIPDVDGVPVIPIQSRMPSDIGVDEVYVWKSDGLFVYWVGDSVKHIDLRKLEPERVHKIGTNGNPHTIYRFDDTVSYVTRFIPPLSTSETIVMPELVESERGHLAELGFL